MEPSKAKKKVQDMINIDELIFDILVSAGIIVLGNLVLQDMKWTEDLGPEFLSIAVLVVEFMLSYYLGKTTAGMITKDFMDSKKTSSLKDIIIPGLFGLVSVYTLFVLWISLPVVLGVPGVLTFVLGIILCIIGAIAGSGMSASGFSDPLPMKEDQDIRKFPLFKYVDSKAMTRHPVIILPIVVFFFVLIYILSIFGDESGLLAVGIFLLSIIAAVLALVVSGFVMMLWIAFYEAAVKKVRVLDIFITKLLVPFILLGILVAWENIYLVSSAKEFGENNIGWVIFALFFTGIIPLRLIMMFKPPLRILNIIIAVAAFAFYIYSIQFISL
ncbi:MAG: hypothetical protein JW904_01730 [Spirochaetales bacterium]|nr:hypothetical protein [Spirochaetales bacterium]